MCLIDNGEDIVCSLDREGDEARVGDDEYLVLGIADDSRL